MKTQEAFILTRGRDNQAYFDRIVVFVAFITLITGAIQYFLAGNDAALWCCVLITTLIGLCGILFFIFAPHFFSSADLFGVMLCFTYGGGALNTLIGYALRGIDVFSFLYSSPTYVGYAMAYVLTIVGFLFLIGRLDKSRHFGRFEVRPEDVSSFLVFALACAAGYIILIISGSIKFQLNFSSNSEDSTISPLASLFSTLAVPVAILAAGLASRISGKKRGLFLIIFIILTIPQVTQGRRILFAIIFLALVAYLYGQSIPKEKFQKLIILLVTGLLAASLGSKFFYALRLASWELGQNASILEIIPTGIANIVDSEKINLDEQIQSNLIDRGFILGYLAEIIERVDFDTNTANGEALYRAALISIPSIIWDEKNNYNAISLEEAVVHPYLGMPIWDAANTILTAGISDWGILGGAVYTLFFVSICSFVLRLAFAFTEKQSALVAVMVAFMIINVESSLSGIFSYLRGILIATLLMWLSTKLIGLYTRRT